MLRFEVPGRPFGKARPRSGKYGVYNPRVNVEYEKKIADCYRLALNKLPEPTDKPIVITINCYYPIPKQTPKKKRELMLDGKIKPMVKPDLDNVMKSVLDALNGLAYLDDKQVIRCMVTKDYAEHPHTTIYIGRYVHEL